MARHASGAAAQVDAILILAKFWSAAPGGGTARSEALASPCGQLFEKLKRFGLRRPNAEDLAAAISVFTGGLGVNDATS
jgi:hypothetical protein